jgi:hypothetical protein
MAGWLPHILWEKNMEKNMENPPKNGGFAGKTIELWPFGIKNRLHRLKVQQDPFRATCSAR